MTGDTPGLTGTLRPLFLSEHEQPPAAIARELAAFVAGARRSLDIAAYDFRLSDPLKEIVAGALRDRAQAGVAIRIAYDADKPDAPRVATGMDPAPAGTGAFVQSFGYPWRRIGGMKLMHNKSCVPLSASAPRPSSRSTSATASAPASTSKSIRYRLPRPSRSVPRGATVTRHPSTRRSARRSS